MKRIIVPLVSLSVLFLASCDKLKELANINFSVDYKETTDVPGLPNSPVIPPNQGLTESIPRIGAATNSEETIKEYNTSSELIKEVKLGKLDLILEAPTTQTFNIVDSIWVYISSTSTGQGEQRVAYKFDIPNDAKQVSLNVEDLNLKDYFLQDSMYFRLQGHFKTAPDSATRLTLDTRFDVLANPLGD